MSVDFPLPEEPKIPIKLKDIIIQDPPPPIEFEPKQVLKIKLRDGKEREIQYLISTMFYSASGKPISAEEFLKNMFGVLPEFFKSEDELRKIWSDPRTRKIFLKKIADIGYDKEKLDTLQKLVDAEKSDLFDVLAYISFSIKPITRKERVNESRFDIFSKLDEKQREFIEFVLGKYIENGFEELDDEKLSKLLNLKYHTIADAEEILGDVDRIRSTFLDFQKNLYTLHR